MAIISSLFIYPIKSCRGISVKQLHFEDNGLRHDRRWMLVDEAGQFLTQRSAPRLALIETKLSDGRLWASLPGHPPLRVSDPTGRRRSIRVWDFSGEADDLGDESAAWFGAALGRPCRLVRFAEDVHRQVSASHTDMLSELAFADGYPALLVSVESLGELNRRLPHPVPMNRFRPNIVVRDCQPFEEDTWQQCQTAELTLSVVKPCSRCAITTVNQMTARRSRQPLATLAQFRKLDGEIQFGQNCVHHGPGVLRIGDELHTIRKQ